MCTMRTRYTSSSSPIGGDASGLDLMMYGRAGLCGQRIHTHARKPEVVRDDTGEKSRENEGEGRPTAAAANRRVRSGPCQLKSNTLLLNCILDDQSIALPV